MRRLLVASLLLVVGHGPAFAQDTIMVGGERKPAFGTPIAFQSGDIACYVTLKDDKGATLNLAADFELCAQEEALKGRRVTLTYKQVQVQATSCQGDPNCRKSETRVLIVAAKPASLAAGSTRPTAPSPAPSPTPSSRQASFCTPLETVIFSCRTGGKLVSVCSSKDAGPGKGYVQYRFGKPDSAEPLELVLPESQSPPPRVATGGSVPFAGGGGSWLTFAKGQIAYTVYTGVGKWGPGGALREKAGLAVDQGPKRLAVLRCDNPKAVQSEVGPDWLAKAGVRSPPAEFDFPD